MSIRRLAIHDDSRTPTCAAPLHIIAGSRASAFLPSLLRKWRTRRLLVIATRRAIQEAELANMLHPWTTVWFDRLHPNPSVETVVLAADVVRTEKPDTVVAVGGGSTMDTAKAARLVPANRRDVVDALAGDETLLLQPPPRLVLVPTTAGSGAEITRFATVYDGDRKRSLDFPNVRADAVLIDPNRAMSCPPRVTYSGVFDAISHAVESYWSVRSTLRSRQFALRALRELLAVGVQPLRSPTLQQRMSLAIASLNAGRAIDISRTTAAHAFSYLLTIRHGIPHGVACLLNLIWLVDYNANHLAACRDTRGIDFVRQRIETVTTILARAKGATAASAALRDLVHQAGMSARFRDYALHPTDLDTLVNDGLSAGGRADNNPVNLDPERVVQAVREQY